MQLLEFQANRNPVQCLSRKFSVTLATTVRLCNFPVANYKGHEVRMPLCELILLDTQWWRDAFWS